MNILLLLLLAAYLGGVIGMMGVALNIPAWIYMPFAFFVGWSLGYVFPLSNS